MRILLCNDDGYRAPGLKALADAFSEIAEVIVIAPEHNCSSASLSLTLTRTLKVEEADNGFFYLYGTPADCAHLALHGYLDSPPDLVISGINHGANLGEDTLYSGTVAVAIEGYLAGVPSLAVSYCCGSHRARFLKVEDFKVATEYAKKVAHKMLENPKNPPWLLSLNIPMVEHVKGLKICPLGKRHSAGAAQATESPRDGVVFWIGHVGEPSPDLPGTDFEAVSQGYATLTPLQLDLTHRARFADLKDFEEDYGAGH